MGPCKETIGKRIEIARPRVDGIESGPGNNFRKLSKSPVAPDALDAAHGPPIPKPTAGDKSSGSPGGRKSFPASAAPQTPNLPHGGHRRARHDHPLSLAPAVPLGSRMARLAATPHRPVAAAGYARFAAGAAAIAALSTDEAPLVASCSVLDDTLI